MYSRPLLPAGTSAPERHKTAEFLIRPLLLSDVIRDYDAVMESTRHLRHLMDPADDWPEGMTVEENMADLGWHEREFTLGHSYAWCVTSPDGSDYLGCCYLYPPSDPAWDADAFYWIRQSRLEDGMEDRLGATYRAWLNADWPLPRIAFPGRTEPWSGHYLREG